MIKKKLIFSIEKILEKTHERSFLEKTFTEKEVKELMSRVVNKHDFTLYFEKRIGKKFLFSPELYLLFPDLFLFYFIYRAEFLTTQKLSSLVKSTLVINSLLLSLGIKEKVSLNLIKEKNCSLYKRVDFDFKTLYTTLYRRENKREFFFKSDTFTLSLIDFIEKTFKIEVLANETNVKK